MWAPAVARSPEGRGGLAAALLALMLHGGLVQAAPPLKVCMAADNAPLSRVADGAPRGLDVQLAHAAAAALGRELVVVPFETSYEKESTLAHEVNALLSSGVCEAVTGFPLLAADLGAPSRPSARVPDHPGAPRRRDRPYVPLGSLAASRAYQGAALGAVMRAPAQEWRSLAELVAQPALRVGTVSGTMAGALALGWRHGALRRQTVSLGQREDALQAVADGKVDVALVPLAQFDGWRLAHPGATLQLTGWRKPLGVNLGVVTLASQQVVRAAFDTAIGRDSGERRPGPLGRGRTGHLADADIAGGVDGVVDERAAERRALSVAVPGAAVGKRLV